MYIYEFIIEQKILLVECNDIETAQSIANQYFYKSLIILKSIYNNMNHYTFINKNFKKYFSKKQVFCDDKMIAVFEMK